MEQKRFMWGGMPCEVCGDYKFRGLMFCLQCGVSYCERHLKPHYDRQIFDKHQLVETSAELEKIICSLHSRVKEVFCCSDQQSVCTLCAITEHRGHDTVLVAAEKTKRQQQLGQRRRDIKQRIEDTEKDIAMLNKHVKANNISHKKASDDSQTMFTQLIDQVQKRNSEVQELITSKWQAEVGQAKELEKKLLQEIVELRQRDAELEQLSHTEVYSQFLLRYSSLSALSERTCSAGISLSASGYFEEVSAAVSDLTKKAQTILSQDPTQISVTGGQSEKIIRDVNEEELNEIIQDLKPIVSPECSQYAKDLLKKNTVTQNELFNLCMYLVAELQNTLKSKEQPSSSSSHSWTRHRVRICTFVTGQTFGADTFILEHIKNQKSVEVVTTSMRDCDIILIFCPITSRIVSDVQAALQKEEVSSSGKNIILVMMHHTREPDYSTGIINWAEKDPTVKLQVDVLFHQTQQGLLQCARNEQAIRKIQSAIQTL